MLPDLSLDELFPDRNGDGRLSARELAALADCWDDTESDRANLDAIGWWLTRASQPPDRRR